MNKDNSHDVTMGVVQHHESADLATDVQTDAKFSLVGQTSNSQEVSEVRAGI